MRTNRLLYLCISALLCTSGISAKYNIVCSAGKGLLAVSDDEFGDGPLHWKVFRDGQILDIPVSEGYFHPYNFDSQGFSFFKKAVGDDLLEGIVSIDGKIVVPALYSTVYPIGQGFYAIGSPEDFTVYRPSDGAKSNKIKGNCFGQISEGTLAVCRNGKYGFLNTNWKVTVPVIYSDVCEFSEGLAAVRTARGKWGFVNKTGRMVIPAIYDHDDTWDDDDGHAELFFRNGIAAVYKGEKYGAINKAGRTVVPFKYHYVSVDTTRNEIVASTWTDNDLVSDYYSMKGRLLRSAEKASDNAPGTFYETVGEEYLMGIRGQDGTVVVKPTYYSIFFVNDMYFACNDNGVDIYDKNGKLLYKDIADGCLYTMLPG